MATGGIFHGYSADLSVPLGAVRCVTGIVTSRMTRDILYLIGELGPKICSV